MTDHAQGGTAASRSASEIDKSAQAEASSAHSRINIPLNLDNWKHIDSDTQEDLIWFHQHLLDRHLTLSDAAKALGYDESTIFRVLKGTYSGSWKNVRAAIATYKRIDEQRGTIQQAVVVENSITRLIGSALDYALANESITVVIGESRMGKTVALRLWRDANNHGCSVLVTAPPYGGTKLLLRTIADAVGVNKNQSIPVMIEAISRSFNKHRILIVDEAHRLLPGDRRSNPTNLEILRHLHDLTGCALALSATRRFDEELRKSHYQFEQLLGRIGMPVRLPRKIKDSDIRPILEQYIRRPSEKFLALAGQIANDLGRLGILVETLKVASRIAHRAKQPLSEEHIFKAVALRRQMMGEHENGRTHQ